MLTFAGIAKGSLLIERAFFFVLTHWPQRLNNGRQISTYALFSKYNYTVLKTPKAPHFYMRGFISIRKELYQKLQPDNGRLIIL